MYQGEAMFWGSYPCNAPYYTTEAFLLNLTALQPDIIIYAGMICSFKVIASVASTGDNL